MTPHGYNDPGPDSLFEKIDGATNRCKGCGATVANSTEARDGHLNADCPAWDAHCRGESVPGWGS